MTIECPQNVHSIVFCFLCQIQCIDCLFFYCAIFRNIKLNCIFLIARPWIFLPSLIPDQDGTKSPSILPSCSALFSIAENSLTDSFFVHMSTHNQSPKIHRLPIPAFFEPLFLYCMSKISITCSLMKLTGRNVLYKDIFFKNRHHTVPLESLMYVWLPFLLFQSLQTTHLLQPVSYAYADDCQYE